LEGLGGFWLELSLIFEFKTLNNQAKHEALIAKLILAKDMTTMNVVFFATLK